MTLRECLAAPDLREKTNPSDLIRTDAPGVYLAPSSHGGRYYVVRNVGTAFVMCSCEAAMHERECKHVIAALELSDRLLTEQEKSLTTEEMTTAVAIAQRSPTVIRAEEMRLQIASHEAAWEGLLRIGARDIASGFAPKGAETPQKCAMILLKGLSLRIPVMEAYGYIDVIEGRPAIRGQMIGALVARSGQGHIYLEETTPMKCVAVGQRDGRRTRITVTIEMFKHLIHKDTWKNYPADMLRWKAIARVGRVVFPDVLSGMDVAGGDDLVDEPDEMGGRVEAIEGDFREVKDGNGDGETRPVAAAGGRSQGAEGDSPPASAPAPGPEWEPELKALLKEKGLAMRDLAPVLGVSDVTRHNYARLIHTYLAGMATPGGPGTIAGLVERAVELLQKGRDFFGPVAKCELCADPSTRTLADGLYCDEHAPSALILEIERQKAEAGS